MYAHWERHPPVHVTAALFAGIKPVAAKPKHEADPALATWIAEMPVMPFPRAGAAERKRARETLQ